jgi:hypothetical protein
MMVPRKDFTPDSQPPDVLGNTKSKTKPMQNITRTPGFSPGCSRVGRSGNVEKKQKKKGRVQHIRFL